MYQLQKSSTKYHTAKAVGRPIRWVGRDQIFCGSREWGAARCRLCWEKLQTGTFAIFLHWQLAAKLTLDLSPVERLMKDLRLEWATARERRKSYLSLRVGGSPAARGRDNNLAHSRLPPTFQLGRVLILIISPRRLFRGVTRLCYRTSSTWNSYPLIAKRLLRTSSLSDTYNFGEVGHAWLITKCLWCFWR